jgi:hypothetical protein
MKRLVLASTILLTGAICFLALSRETANGRQKLRAREGVWFESTRRLEELQSERDHLAEQVRELRSEEAIQPASHPMDPAVAEFLSSNDVRRASAAMQQRIIAALGPNYVSSASFILVAKDALQNSRLTPLQGFPKSGKLKDSVCGILSITPEERQAVENAFAATFERVSDWAKANVQRDGPTNDMLVRYTISVDQKFERGSTEKLFTDIKAAVGEERSHLLENYFQWSRVYTDGAIGDRTNILEIHRLSRPPGLGYRAGWKWESSESINTYPEPITTNKFPAAFRFLFPGGWEEIAQRDGFELPEELKGP